MNVCQKRCLFGGTLLAAGLVSHVHAQQFNIGSTWARTYVREYAYGASDYDYFFGSGGFNVQSNVSNYFMAVGAYASGSTSQFRVSANLKTPFGFDGRGFGQDIYANFTVDQNVNAGVNWDWTLANGYGYLRIIDNTNAVDLYNNSGFSSGSTSVPLVAGNSYTIRGYAGVGRANFDQSSYWEVNVPTPGAAGLLGLAGLTAARRRRTTPRNC